MVNINPRNKRSKQHTSRKMVGDLISVKTFLQRKLELKNPIVTDILHQVAEQEQTSGNPVSGKGAVYKRAARRSQKNLFKVNKGRFGRKSLPL